MRQTVTCLRAEGDVEFKYRAFPSRKLCSLGDLVVLGSSTRLTAKSSEQPEVTTYKSNFFQLFLQNHYSTGGEYFCSTGGDYRSMPGKPKVPE